MAKNSPKSKNTRKGKKEVVSKEKITTPFSKAPIKLSNLRFNLNNKSNRIIILSALTLLLIFLINAFYKRYFVASVGGKLITRNQFYKELVKQDKGKVLEDIITKEIIFQEAKNNNIELTNEEVNLELSKISASVSQQGSTLEEVLALQGMTMEELTENIKIQKTLEKLLNDRINITEEELQKRFDDNKTAFASDTKYEDVKDSLRTELFQEKIADEYRVWIQDKRSTFNVKYFSQTAI